MGALCREETSPAGERLLVVNTVMCPIYTTKEHS